MILATLSFVGLSAVCMAVARPHWADHGMPWIPVSALAPCFVVILLVWCLANAALVQPMRRLAALAAGFGSGDPRTSSLVALSSTAPLDVVRHPQLAFDPPEMRLCHAAFAALARKLTTRDEEIASAQAIIAHNEELSRLSASSEGNAVVPLEALSQVTYLAQGSLSALGYTYHELCGGGWRRLIHPDDQERFAAMLDALGDARSQASLVCRAVRRDGATIWVESLVCRMGIGGCVVTLHDITRHLVMPTPAASSGDANWQAMRPVHIDPVTGLLNRRGFDAALGLEYRCAARLGTPLAMIMIEIDQWRPQGVPDVGMGADACLQVVGHAIGRQLRRSRDRVARYGAAKFTAILPATDRGHAMIVANAIRRAVEEAANPGASSCAIMLGAVRMGVAAVVAGRGEGGPARLVELAETALHDANRHSCASA
jgi:diguanylate cyclase (GGDEF)-like protein/PAS domain S-box-containing protein